MAYPALKYRLSVQGYHKLGEAGILTERDKVELIDGELFHRSPVGSRHAAHLDRLTALLFSVLGSQVIVRVQSPVCLGEYSEPEPDIALLQPRDDFYEAAHPQAADIALLVEVSDTTLGFDREVKMPLYAQAGIAEAWILNIAEHCIEVYSQPSPEGYRMVRKFYRDECIVLPVGSNIHMQVHSIMSQKTS